MKRALLGIVAVAMLVGVPLAGGTASAGPTNRTSLTLVCDRGTGSATVSVTLKDSLFGVQSAGPFTLSCGPDSISGLTRDRQVQVTPFPAGAVIVNTWTWNTGLGSGGCGGGGSLPYKDTCTDANGVGSQLVVR
jgi:hypothetical protein